MNWPKVSWGGELDEKMDPSSSSSVCVLSGCGSAWEPIFQDGLSSLFITLIFVLGGFENGHPTTPGCNLHLCYRVLPWAIEF